MTSVSRQRLDQINNPEKSFCRHVVGHAIERGEIERKPCEKCGNPNSQAHHTDYSSPFKIVWLCELHHKEAHFGEKDVNVKNTQLMLDTKTKKELRSLAQLTQRSMSAEVRYLIHCEWERLGPTTQSYVKPAAHDATGLIYTPALHSTVSIDLEHVRDDVFQEEEAQAARDAAKEQE